MLNYPESLVAHYTGILNAEKCEAILSRMSDYCNLSNASSEQFKAAALSAASEIA